MVTIYTGGKLEHPPASLAPSVVEAHVLFSYRCFGRRCSTISTISMPSASVDCSPPSRCPLTHVLHDQPQFPISLHSPLQLRQSLYEHQEINDKP
ncbi:hypothetical protein TNCV_143871 [Trichonephila clavipes]|nr:hypothetical protein TNCV_143871 [Trichonephila clavipes]